MSEYDARMGAHFALLAALAGCGSYVAPCRVDRVQTVLGGVQASRLSALPGRQVLAVSLQEAAVLDSAGTLVGRWPVTVPPFSRMVWVDGLGLLSLEQSVTAGELRKALWYQFVGLDSSTEPSVELVACVRCSLIYQAVALEGRVIVLYAQDTGPARYFALSPRGQELSSGALALADAAPGSLAISSRGDGLVLGTPSGWWLLDAELQPRAGPIPLGGAFALSTVLDWTPAQVTSVWLDLGGNMLWRSFTPTGDPLGETRRLSKAYGIEAALVQQGRLGVVFSAGGEFFAATDASGRKLGGDLDLGEAFAPALLVDGDPPGFTLFRQARERIERLVIVCDES